MQLPAEAELTQAVQHVRHIARSVKSGTYLHTWYELLPSLVATLLECPSSPRSVAAAIVAYAASTVASVKKQHPLAAWHAITLRNIVQFAQRALVTLRLIFPADNRELGQIGGSCGCFAGSRLKPLLMETLLSVGARTNRGPSKPLPTTVFRYFKGAATVNQVIAHCLSIPALYTAPQESWEVPFSV